MTSFSGQFPFYYWYYYTSSIRGHFSLNKLNFVHLNEWNIRKREKRIEHSENGNAHERWHQHKSNAFTLTEETYEMGRMNRQYTRSCNIFQKQCLFFACTEYSPKKTEIQMNMVNATRAPFSFSSTHTFPYVSASAHMIPWMEAKCNMLRQNTAVVYINGNTNTIFAIIKMENSVVSMAKRILFYLEISETMVLRDFKQLVSWYEYKGTWKEDVS